MDFLRLFPLMGLMMGGISLVDGEGGAEGDVNDDNPPAPAVDDNDSTDGDVDDLPEGFDPKRAYGENKRKTAKIADLEKEISELKSRPSAPVAPQPKRDILEIAMQDPEMAKDISRYKERFGADDDDVRAHLRISGYSARKVAEEMVSPINESMADTHYDKAITKLSEDTEYGYIIKNYGSEIKSFLTEKKVDRKYWGSPDFLVSVIGVVAAKHLKDFRDGAKKRIDREMLSEEPGGRSSAAPAGINWDDVKEYATDIGYTENDLKDKEIRKSVLAAYQAKKKATKEE